jgi:hypothetical protein
VEFAWNGQGNALILVYVFASKIPLPRNSALNPNQFWTASVQKLCFVFSFIKVSCWNDTLDRWREMS